MHYLAGILLVAQFVLLWVLEGSIHLPGLDYLAWALWLAAIALIASSMLTLHRKGQVPEGKGYIATETLVTTGVYALVRHPLYLGWTLMYVATFLFKPNWILAAVGIVGMGCVYRFTVQAEALLKEKFGEPYDRYMRSVPRYNLLTGAIRQLSRRRMES
jgi:protein-S-isoprenylcysteine O-methyltransferase Ste14